MSLVGVFNSAYCQTLEVYHGTNGKDRSQFVSDLPKGINATNDYTLTARKGKKVTITILNVNPTLYEYSFKRSDAKIDDNIPDLTALLEALTKTINLTPTDATGAGVVVAAAPGFPAPPAPRASAELQTLFDSINVMKNDLKAAKAAIEASDDPESINDAKARNSVAGFRQAKSIIKRLGSLKKADLNAELVDNLKKFIQKE